MTAYELRISDWSSDVCSSVLQVVAVAEQGRVRIDVIDQGCGMTRAFIRDELFKPFVSTTDSGFGLGAFEALQIAQPMGGAIEVASEPGKGSNFTIGRASWRERVCPYGSITVVSVSLKKKKTKTQRTNGN